MEVNDDQNNNHPDKKSQIKANSDVKVDVGPQNQTLFDFQPILIPTHLPVNDESNWTTDQSSYVPTVVEGKTAPAIFTPLFETQHIPGQAGQDCVDIGDTCSNQTDIHNETNHNPIYWS